jgi:DNA-binding CsgD family transcriptional regulator
MARKPYKYIINLTETERQELKTLVSCGKTERRLADRARMILWADEGVTIAETQRRLGCSEQIVLNWRRDFLARRDSEGPVAALKDRPRSGRPAIFSP